jgi:hypothetical protein
MRADDVASVFVIHERDASQDTIKENQLHVFVNEGDDLAFSVPHNASVEASKQDGGIKSVVHFGLSVSFRYASIITSLLTLRQAASSKCSTTISNALSRSATLIGSASQWMHSIPLIPSNQATNRPLGTSRMIPALYESSKAMISFLFTINYKRENRDGQQPVAVFSQIFVVLFCVPSQPHKVVHGFFARVEDFVNVRAIVPTKVSAEAIPEIGHAGAVSRVVVPTHGKFVRVHDHPFKVALQSRRPSRQCGCPIHRSTKQVHL